MRWITSFSNLYIDSCTLLRGNQKVQWKNCQSIQGNGWWRSPWSQEGKFKISPDNSSERNCRPRKLWYDNGREWLSYDPSEKQISLVKTFSWNLVFSYIFAKTFCISYLATYTFSLITRFNNDWRNSLPYSFVSLLFLIEMWARWPSRKKSRPRILHVRWLDSESPLIR